MDNLPPATDPTAARIRMTRAITQPQTPVSVARGQAGAASLAPPTIPRSTACRWRALSAGGPPSTGTFAKFCRDAPLLGRTKEPELPHWGKAGMVLDQRT